MIQNTGSLSRYFVLLALLCTIVWVLGITFDIELFPGFKLFQAGLAMPMFAALITTGWESGWAGITTLLRRTYDAGNIRPRFWFLPMLLLFPSFGLINYLILVQSGQALPAPTFSWVTLLGYCTVFFLTYGEELGLTGYAVDRLQKRYNALQASLILGVVWAAYHVPGFIISGYYAPTWIIWHAIYTILARILFVWIYNNSGKSLFAMALCHWTFGLFWIFWPQDNLQKAVPFYQPQITAIVALIYASIIVYFWGPKTLAQLRFRRVAQNK